ncbi:MAG: MarR family winged helix-turn-helix transcriptional regulator [Paracoccaceae bacterium]
MTESARDFDLERFLPYLLNQVAEATSAGFHAAYRDRYGMTRTQWRVLANLGKFGAMTARDICGISHIEKTKVSRAVTALEDAGFLNRVRSDADRRAEILSLTDAGQTVFAQLGQLANSYDSGLRARLGPAEAAQLDALLRRVLQTEGHRMGGGPLPSAG